MTKVPYVTFMKHAQKVVKSPSCKSRPILGGVLHRESYIAVTDSHRLYFALTDDNVDTEKVICPKTGTEIDGNYPDIVRLIPEPDTAALTVTLDVTTAAQAVKLIEQAGKVGKASDLIVIKRNMGDVTFSTHDDSLVTCTYTVSDADRGEDAFVMYASARYVKEAFELIKEAGFEEATFRYYGSNRPFTFTAGNLTALILPVRKQ